MNIGDKLGSWTRWVGEKVTGKQDFRSTEETRSRDYAVIGAAAGAVAGATVGAITGFDSQKSNRIEEVWVNRQIVDKTMNGYSHHTRADYSTECVARDDDNNCTRTETNLDGWWHSYSPNITDRVVGNYTEPTFQNSKAWEPLMGGFVGAIGGGLIGLGTGLGVAALQRALTKDEVKPERPKLSPKAQEDLAVRAGSAAIGGAILGTLVGAYAGRNAGVIELASRQTHARSWAVPQMETRTLGQIPSSHYERNWFGSTWASPDDVNTNANQPVNRSVPVYHRDGDVRMTSAEQTFQTNRYGPIFGGLAGGIIGAGVGLAAGLVVGVSDKLLTENAAAKAADKVIAA